MAERLTISDVASYPRPGMDAPGLVGFTPDSSGRDLAAMRTMAGSCDRCGESMLQRASAPSSPVPERTLRCRGKKELLRERTRTRELGVASYAWARDADVPILMIPGPALRISVDGEPLRELPGAAGALTPTLSPDGTQVSFVRGGELFALALNSSSEAKQLTTGAEDGLTHGLAEYIAQEEFGPASRALVVEGQADRLSASRRTTRPRRIQLCIRAATTLMWRRIDIRSQAMENAARVPLDCGTLQW